MKRRTHNSIAFLIAACGLSATGPVSAEEPAIYESLDDVAIGRIFLSPAERRSLDGRRGKELPVSTTDVRVAPAKTKKSPDAAGYILRSGGPSRVWSNGDFVPVEDVSGVTFPGDIEVIRNAAQEPETNPDTADDGS